MHLINVIKVILNLCLIHFCVGITPIYCEIFALEDAKTSSLVFRGISIMGLQIVTAFYFPVNSLQSFDNGESHMMVI